MRAALPRLPPNRCSSGRAHAAGRPAAFELARPCCRAVEDIAHRTFSGDGKRRISLEILERNPLWANIGNTPVVPNDSGAVGGFRFDAEGGENVRISWPDGSLVTPRHFFVRGLAALVAYEMHLEHNEFEGGFIVHDLGAEVRLKAPSHEETLPGSEVLATFDGLLQRWR